MKSVNEKDEKMNHDKKLRIIDLLNSSMLHWVTIYKSYEQGWGRKKNGKFDLLSRLWIIVRVVLFFLSHSHSRSDWKYIFCFPSNERFLQGSKFHHVTLPGDNIHSMSLGISFIFDLSYMFTRLCWCSYFKGKFQWYDSMSFTSTYFHFKLN